MGAFRKNGLLIWLLAANLVMLTFLGGKYLYQTVRGKQEQHRQSRTFSDIMIRAGGMNSEDASKLAEASEDIQHGGAMSDAEVDWCLRQFQSPRRPYMPTTHGRVFVFAVLYSAVPAMDGDQKEKVFQTMKALMAADSRQDESGSDLREAALMMGRLKDARAIPLLQARKDDPRPLVHRAVRVAMSKINNEATQ